MKKLIFITTLLIGSITAHAGTTNPAMLRGTDITGITGATVPSLSAATMATGLPLPSSGAFESSFIDPATGIPWDGSQRGSSAVFPVYTITGCAAVYNIKATGYMRMYNGRFQTYLISSGYGATKYSGWVNGLASANSTYTNMSFVTPTVISVTVKYPTWNRMGPGYFSRGSCVMDDAIVSASRTLNFGVVK